MSKNLEYEKILKKEACRFLRLKKNSLDEKIDLLFEMCFASDKTGQNLTFDHRLYQFNYMFKEHPLLKESFNFLSYLHWVTYEYVLRLEDKQNSFIDMYRLSVSLALLNDFEYKLDKHIEYMKKKQEQ